MLRGARVTGRDLLFDFAMALFGLALVVALGAGIRDAWTQTRRKKRREPR